MHICPNCIMAALIALPFLGKGIKWAYAKFRARFPKKQHVHEH